MNQVKISAIKMQKLFTMKQFQLQAFGITYSVNSQVLPQTG